MPHGIHQRARATSASFHSRHSPSLFAPAILLAGLLALANLYSLTFILFLSTLAQSLAVCFSSTAKGRILRLFKLLPYDFFSARIFESPLPLPLFHSHDFCSPSFSSIFFLPLFAPTLTTPILYRLFPPLLDRVVSY